MSNNFGTFTGVGVGPGPAEFITVKGLGVLMQADKILVPRAKGAKESVALTCIRGLQIPEEKLSYLDYPMSNDDNLLASIYKEIAEKIITDLKENLNLVYITIGDPYIYSTYSYTVHALKEQLPEIAIATHPGISSFQALAAALDFPLALGKESILILPCPETVAELKEQIGNNDNIVLMKIGDRFGWVRDLLRELGILSHCVLGKRIGLDNEILTKDIASLDEAHRPGYLSVLIIRKNPPGGRKRQ